MRWLRRYSRSIRGGDGRQAAYVNATKLARELREPDPGFEKLLITAGLTEAVRSAISSPAEAIGESYV
jgi:hypothetical protein